MVSPIIRPNGKTYRPRKPGMRAYPLEDDYGYDFGVMVLGTLDPDRAQPFASEMCAYWFDMPAAVDPVPGWYRDGFQNGQRSWIRDEERGAPGVMFRAADAPSVVTVELPGVSR